VKVISVIDSLGQGGAERSLLDLAVGVREHGIDIEIATLKAQTHGFRNAAETLGVGVQTIGPGVARAAVALRRLIRESEPRVVHSTLFDSDLVARLGAARSGVPVLTSLVNVTYDKVRLADPKVSHLGLAWRRRVDGWTARHLADRFHCITRVVADSGIESLGIDPNRIRVIPRGRSREEFHPAGSGTEVQSLRRTLGIGADDFVLVSVGRQEWQKGHRHLIDAMPRVLARHHNLSLLLVGREGYETSELRAQVHRLGIDEHVHFLGDRRDVPALLRASDVFVFPSVYEGLGGAILEAMATGLPVVASRLPATVEILGETGFFATPADAEALAVVLDDVLSRPDLSTAGMDGHRRFLDRYESTGVMASMADLFREVAAAGRVRTRSSRD